MLAKAGLLDGRRATTHWLDAENLAAWYPNVEVDAEVLYVDHGDVVTAAGGAAALDVCLHLVRRDHGAAVAAELARCSVMPLEREGGQAQFIDHEPPAAAGDSLEPVLRWAEKHLDTDLSTQALVQRAATSPRTLARRFHEQVGATPAQWVIGARIRRARELLESTDVLISEVAAAVGYRSPSAFRDRFGERVGVSPQGYRRNFQRSERLPLSS